MMKQSKVRRDAAKQKQHLSGNVRRASEIPSFLEVDEKDWKKLIPKSRKEDFTVGAEDLEQTEARVTLGNYNGVGAKQFSKKTNRMIAEFNAFGLHYTFEDNVFYFAVDHVSKTNLELVAKYGGSNSIPSEFCEELHAQVFYEEGFFYLFSPMSDEPLYVADSWDEFKVLIRCIPMFFNLKAKDGRLKLFDWERYMTALIKKHRK